MLVLPDGSQVGTIGGGILEAKTLQRALRALRSGDRPDATPIFLQHNHPDRPDASGLRCGGAQTNVEVILHRDSNLVLARRVALAEAARLGACLRLDRTGLRLLKRTPTHSQVQIQWQGGPDWIAHVPLDPADHAVVFGGGHCGATLARLLHDLDFAVTVVEPRGPIPTLLNLPNSITRLHSSWEETVPLLPHIEHTMAVVMTHGLATDIEALAAVLPFQFLFVGVMGSRRKVGLIHEALAKRGFTARQRATIAGPVGLLLESDTPTEIAVSVAAQLLVQRRGARLAIKQEVQNGPPDCSGKNS